MSFHRVAVFVALVATIAALTLMPMPATAQSTAAPVSGPSSASSTATAAIKKAFAFQQRGDSTLLATSVVTQDALRTVANYDSVGAGGSSLSVPFESTTPVRMNHLSELLVTTAVMLMIDANLLPALDSAIPTQYLPRGIAFFNPAYPSTPLTLRHLLTHTSTITDGKFATFAKTSPDPVLDIRSFAEAYFLQSSQGAFTIATDIFTAKSPGTSASYQYSKANIALLTFIGEQVVIATPTVVSTTQKTFLSYVHEKIISPLGMTSTFVRMPDGSLPQLAYQSNVPLFNDAVMQDQSSAGVEMTRITTHPAYFAQSMAYSTTGDVSKLMRALFFDPRTATTSSFRSIGSRMKSTTISVLGLTTANTAQVSQGLGIMFFDGAQVCSFALTTGAVSRCPFSSTSSVWGVVATGEHSQMSAICSDSLSSTNPTCVTSAHAFFQSATVKSSQLGLAMAGASFQSSIGDTSTITQTGSSVNGNNALYGVWVFFGVIGVLIFTVVAAYVTEYVIQPAPAITGVAPPTAAVPPPAPRETYFDN